MSSVATPLEVSEAVTPFSLKNAPALIERLLPVQKLSAEAYKEQMAGSGKTLTALGSYWKGRKPLILNKACILACLLPATKNRARDLEIFEKLMAMDDESFVARQKRRFKPKEILGKVSVARIDDYFTIEPEGILPTSSPVDWSDPAYDAVKIAWREDITELERRRIEVQLLPGESYQERVNEVRRPEEVIDNVHGHIWEAVNLHLGTDAYSFPELVEQLGIMRYGHRPRVADTFCGSGQIPFEAARLGCDAYASDLNPVACMLTWGSFNIIGGSAEDRRELAINQQELLQRVQAEIDKLGVETDGRGWRAKVFLYCAEVRCVKSGWMVSLLPTLVISKGYRVIAELVPDSKRKRYEIAIRSGVTDKQVGGAENGTVRTDGRGQDPYLIHTVNGTEYRTKISTLRGDFRKDDGNNDNRLRLWEKQDFRPRPEDIFQERLYCVQWMRPKKKRKGDEYEFRAVTTEDLKRERIVEEFIAKRLVQWQANGLVPDMRIEPGDETTRLFRERGWTHWHHLFNSRQLLIAGLVNQSKKASSKFLTVAVADQCSRLSRWNGSASKGAGGNTSNTFDNQALNTLFTYGHRALQNSLSFLQPNWKSFPLEGTRKTEVQCISASVSRQEADIFVTDPPYGDAVKYEEILEFFIAWMRKNPPPEFADWIWDSRRTLAIKGEDEEFRRSMVAAYKQMAQCMPDNGIQVIMFTHQSGSIWADMANIVWASGLQVTAAWYVATETDSALRDGSYVKGTILLVLRKRRGKHKTTRDDLAWEIQEEVEAQVQSLVGLNQETKNLHRDENVFKDADIQMAGYAAALRVLTHYSVIDGRDMSAEAIRPRIKGETTFVDSLIAFAVATASQCLVPKGISKTHWDKINGAERFYLKMLDMEAGGAKSLDNYQNFAKALKVRDFKPLLASLKANNARLKSAVEFGRTEIGEGSELHQSVLRAVLYAVMELTKNLDGDEVIAHLMLNIPNYYGDVTQREMAAELADYLTERFEALHPKEAVNARVLCELLKNQRLG